MAVDAIVFSAFLAAKNSVMCDNLCGTEHWHWIPTLLVMLIVYLLKLSVQLLVSFKSSTVMAFLFNETFLNQLQSC